MAIPSAGVDVANLALDLIGESPVTNVKTPTKARGVKVARGYDSARRVTLHEGVYNFSKKYDALSRNGSPDFAYADSYKLPNDYIRLLVVGGETEGTNIRNYDIVGRNLYVSNDGAASINVMYIADIEDIKLWSPLTLEVLKLRTALNLAYAFAKDEGMINRINELLKVELPGAQSIDGQERPPRRIQRSKYRDIRSRMTADTPGYYVDFGE